MKKLFLILFLIFSSVMVADASSISNINLDIYVDKFGNAQVTETWNAYINDYGSTEGYHPYYNLGNSTITNLQVTMDGTPFTTINNWNVKANFSEKAYKSGIYTTGNELDLCFGITSYGYHTYVMKYKINNFIYQLEDADMIYWNLFPYDFSLEPDNVNIKIYSDFKYKDTLDVWGYGKYGAPCYVYNGVIEMTSDGKIYSDEYLTILVKFPKGTFQTNNTIDKDFDYYYEMAEEGSTTYKKESNILGIIATIFNLVFNLGIIFFVTGMLSKSTKNNKCSFGITGNKVRKDILPFREIPYDKDIFYAYWVAHNYNLTEKKEDFLGAVILKWLKDGNVRIEKVVKNGLFKDKEESNIIFVSKPTNNSLEGKLYDYMYTASKDGKLENNEFKNWCSNNYTKILSWFDDVLSSETLKLVEKGKATTKVGKTMKVFNYEYYEVDPSMMQTAEQVAGLKKFLKEFTLIKEREPIEVKLWNEYLIYAQIFGIADEVADQFKKLYPEIITDMDAYGYDYTDVIFINSITRDGIRSASTAKSRAESYSSGGGGFSSGGGGGGSFGGGGGGGGFR